MNKVTSSTRDSVESIKTLYENKDNISESFNSITSSVKFVISSTIDYIWDKF